MGSAINLGVIESQNVEGTTPNLEVNLGTHSLDAGYYLLKMELKDSKCPEPMQQYAARAVINRFKLNLVELMIESGLPEPTYVLRGRREARGAKCEPEGREGRLERGGGHHSSRAETRRPSAQGSRETETVSAWSWCWKGKRKARPR